VDQIVEIDVGSLGVDQECRVENLTRPRISSLARGQPGIPLPDPFVSVVTRFKRRKEKRK